MPAKPKLTKFLLAYALSRSDNISRIARDLEVSRYTVYRSMKRWRLKPQQFCATLHHSLTRRPQ
jgi:transcriptional regulator of acetoin/glycerol metabolism